MKAKDLIKLLQTFDGDLEVVVFNGEFDNAVERVELQQFDVIDNEYYYEKNGSKKALVIV